MIGVAYVDFRQGLTGIHISPLYEGGKVSILFVHGMWGQASQFIPLIELLAEEGCDCWAIDLSHQAGSEKDIADIEVAMDYIRSNNNGLPLLLAGHSRGALLCQAITKKYANTKVDALIMMASAMPRQLFWSFLFSNLPLAFHILVHPFIYLLAMLRGTPFKMLKPATEEFLFNNMHAEVRDREYEKLLSESGIAARELMLKRSIPIEPGFDCPALVIGATHDAMVPNAIQKKLARYHEVPYAQVVANHMLMVPGGLNDVETLVGNINMFIHQSRVRRLTPNAA